ncbi:DegT/DnrJ/EryC1/StrS family aminotransferase [Natronolimnobius sp. AArcel1]|uniref:DegT/DnrJ/EryC1/StrS family aminotransferase n=1 Tax=Natronolimnobius sp. AArcel1 TaxID=1679093 RepID=UPI0013EBA9E8|nr:DegT/DnrJ/EryC1/StrS family aminotransferase [Natronolimnobius sp. AArcel1]NGM70631.1 DegT/DnrJ/EryC1/StrS family aminotransferase [Natronolimnobius sp. AArcel1]
MGELAITGGPKAAATLEVPEWPQLNDSSRQYVEAVLESGNWCRNSDGADACDRLEAAFADYHDAEHAIAVSNGTVAIELALRACGVQPGDEVIVPSYSFIASASAIPTVGAVPRFVDTNVETYNIDLEHLEERITDRTVGILGVHFAGYPMDMDRLLPIIEEHDLFLIEDAAHAQGSEWCGEKVGTFGDFGTFSFQETKSLSSGEGGIIVTDDDVLADRARLMHNIGRRQGATGYYHYRLSTNARLSELQAALALGQLETLEAENQTRERNEEILLAELADIEGIQTKPRDERITARGYCIENFRYDSAAFDGLPRETFIEALQAEGVPVGEGYEMPLYRQPAFYREEVGRLVPDDVDLPNYPTRHLPGVEELCETNITYPHEVLLAEEDGIRSVADAIRKIQANTETLLD